MQVAINESETEIDYGYNLKYVVGLIATLILLGISALIIDYMAWAYQSPLASVNKIIEPVGAFILIVATDYVIARSTSHRYLILGSMVAFMSWMSFVPEIWLNAVMYSLRYASYGFPFEIYFAVYFAQ